MNNNDISLHNVRCYLDCIFWRQSWKGDWHVAMWWKGSMGQ